MKKTLVLILMLVLPAALIGCATTREMDQVQAEQRILDAKVQQAVQDAQAAKAAANAAQAKADDATVRADNAVKAAEERERIADEKAKQADAAFQKSMKK